MKGHVVPIVAFPVVLLLLLPLRAGAATHTVAQDGSRRFAAIQAGVNAARAGDTVLVMPGTYVEQVRISRSGTAAEPIIIAGQGKAVVDGEGRLAQQWGHLVSVQGDYVEFRGFEVRNSAGMGVGIRGNHSVVKNLNVHHCQENGILICGQAEHSVAEDCTVWWNCTANEYNKRRKWASGLSAARNPTYSTIRDNVVFNNWGEGVSTYEASHTTIEGNVIYDNWSVNLYVSDASHNMVRRNMIYTTSDARFMPDGYPRAVCISLADEKGGEFTSRHNTVINNVTLGGNRGFYFWTMTPDPGLRDVLVAHNTFVNSGRETCFQISAGNHENTRIENNIIVQEDNLPVAHVAAHSGLTFSHNLWSKSPPPSAHGTGDVISDAKLAKAGSTAAGEFTADWFRISETSPARDQGKRIAEVAEDFWEEMRGNRPDIGADEYTVPKPKSGKPGFDRLSDEQAARLRRIAAKHFGRRTRLTFSMRAGGKHRIVRVKDVSAEGIAVVYRGGKTAMEWDLVPQEALVKIVYGLRSRLSGAELEVLAAALNSVGRAADARTIFRAAKQKSPAP